MTAHAYDRALKNLFSHPEMLENLIKTFVSHDWVNQLDFSSLHQTNVEHISETLEDRKDDLIWKIRANDKWLYLIFMLEFQSSKDEFMAIRVATYSGLIYQDLIKEDKDNLDNQKLPPIFSLVLYTGSSPWKAATTVRECLSEAIPPGLMKYQLNSEYIVLDIGRIPLHNYTSNDIKGNLVLSLIEFERASTKTEIKIAIDRASKNLNGKVSSLKRAFMVYVVKALKLPKRYPNIELDGLSEKTMLHERIDQIYDDLKQEGRQEGRHEIAYRILKKLLNESYSSDIPKNVQVRLDKASTEELQQWLDKMLDSRVHAKELD